MEMAKDTKKIPNITNHQGSASQNHRNYLKPVRTAIIKKENVGKAMERRETLYIFCGTVNWYNHNQNQYGVSQKIKNTTVYDPVTPPFVHTQKNCNEDLEEISALPC